MRLGEKQVLQVVKKVDFGVYLGSDEERVLLPKKQLPKELDIGDAIEVFLYKDSSDRLIATTSTPKLTVNGLAMLKVIDTGRMGAFLDWGLEKDLLLPFKQQTYKVQKGDYCLVTLYVDKSERLCATMKVYHFLFKDSPYERGSQVSGLIYDASDEFGLFVAVDNRYSARIPPHEIYGTLALGLIIQGRVSAVKKDGKLDISVRDTIPQQMGKDATKILQIMKEKYGGELPFTDKGSPELIRKEFSMSKAAFKRGIGRLLKEGKIEISENSIRQI